MSATTANPSSGQYFQIERHGELAIVVPLPEVEDLSEDVITQAVPIVLAPLKDDPPAGLIVDLGQVGFVGSNFLTFLLRCHKLVKEQGSDLVLAGVQPRVRELLRITNLDTLWALYDTRAEAVEALAGTD